MLLEKEPIWHGGKNGWFIKIITTPNERGSVKDQFPLPAKQLHTHPKSKMIVQHLC